MMAVFAQLDTTDLIYEAALHTGEFEDGADETRQLGPVIGASYALNKVLYYLDALDRAEEERLAVGKEIARLRGEANGQRPGASGATRLPRVHPSRAPRGRLAPVHRLGDPDLPSARAGHWRRWCLLVGGG